MSADNNLNKYTQLNLEQMMQIGSTEEFDIVVYLVEKKDEIKYGKLLHIQEGHCIVLDYRKDVDGGDKDEFYRICSQVFTGFKSDHHALIFWDHGSGCLNMSIEELFKGILYDDSTSNYLSDKDLIEVLSRLSKEVLHKKIDIIGFDACLMASIELQAMLSEVASLYVASEELEEGTGWNYHTVLKNITGKSSPAKIADSLVNAYKDAYKDISDFYTLSAVDLKYISKLADNIELVGFHLDEVLKKHPDFATYLFEQTSKENIICFDNPDKYDYVDLDHLYSKILWYVTTFLKDDSLAQLIVEGHRLTNKAVMHKVAGLRHQDSCGISIYWAREQKHTSYSKLAWTLKYPQWNTFINTYLAVRSNNQFLIG
jgi:hypothetical protein